jgi:hypothetical protein
VDFGSDGSEGFERVAGAGIDELRVRYVCPPDLERHFARLDAPRAYVKTVRQNVNVPIAGDRPTAGDAASIGPTITTTYLHPAYALGTANRECTWNQRRALIAYWGTPQAPSYLHVRLLHDGYDFASGQIFTAQREGAAVAAINIATDGGDRHISLDKVKDATIRAKDVRLRFEFGGDAAKAPLSAPARLTDPVDLSFGDVKLRLAVPFAQFGPSAGAWEAGEAGNTKCLDVVLYHGDERAIRLSDLAAAAVGISVEFSASGAPRDVPTATLNDGTLSVGLAGLEVAVPVRPGPTESLQQAARMTVAP